MTFTYAKLCGFLYFCPVGCDNFAKSILTSVKYLWAQGNAKLSFDSTMFEEGWHFLLL